MIMMETLVKSIAKSINNLKDGIFVSVVLVILAMCSTPAFADSTQQSERVRVGYMDYHGFIDKEREGQYTGYAVDYLNKISEYTGFQYEYVWGEWSELLRKLENKEIDFICSAQYNEQRAVKYDFSAYPIGYTQGLLYALDNNTRLCYEDYNAFNGMMVGILRGNAMNSILEKYAKQHGFTYILKEYDTESDVLTALKNGDVDAMCSEHLAYHTGLNLIAKFGADAYYIMSYKGNPYMERINFALQEIKIDVDFEAKLFHKYYDNSAAVVAIPFTRKELEYIANSEPITVGIMTNRSPLSNLDNNGNPVGMIPDLMQLISQKSGLKFQYQTLMVGQTGYDYLNNSDGKLVAGVAASYFSKINTNLLQSEPVQKSSIVFVGRKGEHYDVNKNLIVAIPNGFIDGNKAVAANYPNFGFYNCKTSEECLEAIREGKADITMQNLYVARERLQSPLYDELDIIPSLSFQEVEKIVALPQNDILMSIINKSIAAISEEQQNDIIISNTIAKGYKTNINEIVYKYRYSLIAIVVLVAMVIVLLAVFLIIKQRNYYAIESVNAKLAKANGQLEESVIQAYRANIAKSQFLSRMSHEIRTPMNAIVGLTEIAKQYLNEPTKIEDYLAKIAVSSKVLLNIINDVLDMSAIESNKLKIANENFDLKQVLTGISTIYYPQCQSKGIEFKMSIDVENEFLKGDSLRVSQILLNLVSNAYKFTAKGGTIKVLVKETACKDGKSYIRFIVSDTGCGMTDEMKARLFKPFEQESTGTTRKYGGSGLGLSIAKNLVDMMHGAIIADSVKDEGTTFTVDLPFDLVELPISDKKKELKALRILAVDDDETAREYTSTLLNRIGLSFDITDSGRTALTMIEAAAERGEAYDICLIDWKMPDMDGVELTKQIRGKQGDKSLIIIVSAFDLNEIQEVAKKAGADYFVTKPLFQSTVFNILTELTGGREVPYNDRNDSYDFLGHKVLLAEDQDLNADIAIELLSLVNMAVDRAIDGKAVVEMFAAAAPGTYDAILMDVQMPEMDGYEATAAIRALKREDANTIPIYAMTANAFTEDVATAFSVGMNGHIAKPIDTKILYALLYDVIKNNGCQKTSV